MNATDKRLLKDLDRLMKRVNSEEGIPMFLACEDLASAVGDEPKVFASRSLNDDFVSLFCRDVDLMQSSRPNAPLCDIAKLVERLAECDFALAKTEEL